MSNQRHAESVRMLPLDVARCSNAACVDRWSCFRFTTGTPPEAHRVVFSEFTGQSRRECGEFIELPKP